MIHITIVYPTDPFGQIPGGTDTCIRDMLRFAPDDISIKLVGVSTDPLLRPVNKVTRCGIGKSEFDFLPVGSFASLNKQMRMPLSARFTLSLLGKEVAKGADILQFHRIEPAFLFFGCKAKKIFVMHQNMNILHNKNSDIRWKYFPGAYFFLERIAMPSAAKTYVVREDGVTNYRQRYPRIADRFQFLPTWMDPDFCFPLGKKIKAKKKAEIINQYDWHRDDLIFISVGRIDHQKNPHLLIASFQKLRQRRPDARLVMVGDGVLRQEIEDLIEARELSDAVRVLGVLEHRETVKMIQISDVMVLSSAYEGMPRCVVEALGCGIPVVSTNVGEVARVVHDGKNGFVVSNHNADVLADAMAKSAQNQSAFSGQPCLETVRAFSAPVILNKIYEAYRTLSR